MVTQYPHSLYTYATQPAVQNELGDWVPGASTMQACGACREETAGRGGIGKGISQSQEDFKDIVNMALVQAPLSCPHIPEGHTVVVSNAPLPPETTMDEAKALQRQGTVRIIGICKKFDRSTFHVRIWL